MNRFIEIPVHEKHFEFLQELNKENPEEPAAKLIVFYYQKPDEHKHWNLVLSQSEKVRTIRVKLPQWVIQKLGIFADNLGEKKRAAAGILLNTIIENIRNDEIRKIAKEN